VLDALRAYSFPGNVRELENVLERALAFANDGVIEVGDLSLKAARMLDVQNAPPHEPAGQATAPPLPAAAEALGAAPPLAEPAAAAPDTGELPSSLPDYLNQVERDIIVRALNQTHFNRTQAASLLGISLRQLRYSMQKLDIHAPEP
jgi:two-component system response regulator PilR (NtrC family)